MRQRQSVVVERPMGEVAAFLADPTNLPRWIDAVEGVDLEEERDQTPTDTERLPFRQEVDEAGESARFEGVRVLDEAGREVRYRFTSEAGEVTTIFRLEERSEGTRVEQELDVPLSRIATKVLAPILYLANRSRMRDQLAALKLELERDRSAGR